jgi:hypothetical protein
MKTEGFTFSRSCLLYVSSCCVSVSLSHARVCLFGRKKKHGTTWPAPFPLPLSLFYAAAAEATAQVQKQDDDGPEKLVAATTNKRIIDLCTLFPRRHKTKQGWRERGREWGREGKGGVGGWRPRVFFFFLLRVFFCALSVSLFFLLLRRAGFFFNLYLYLYILFYFNLFPQKTL